MFRLTNEKELTPSCGPHTIKLCEDCGEEAEISLPQGDWCDRCYYNDYNPMPYGWKWMTMLPRI